MKVSYWRFGSVGSFAYQGSVGNDGSMIVRLYWFCALRLIRVSNRVAVLSPLLWLDWQDVKEVVRNAGAPGRSA